jgi:DNA (cytosine-5)-methyltransferase 1
MSTAPKKKVITPMREIPVIDLFAGPGGLSFGFSAFKGKNSFRIALSIEKDQIAYQTLLLRAFVRQFAVAPEEYYRFIRHPDSEALNALREMFPREWRLAEHETKCWELGVHPFDEVAGAINAALDGATNWVLLGGPPCQAYSLVGRARRKNDADFATDHRHTLYREYLKIVAVHQPAIFVMENVKGILSSRHGTRSKGGSIFQQILTDLRSPSDALLNDRDVARWGSRFSPGYSIFSFSQAALLPELLSPQDFVVRSEDWGIPQGRHRVILLGVRNDLMKRPKILSDLFDMERGSIESVIGAMPKIRSRISGGEDDEFEWRRGQRLSVVATQKEKRLQHLGRLMATVLRSSSVPKNTGRSFIAGQGRFKPKHLEEWLWDPRLGGVIQHEARSHMTADIARYFFLACFAHQEQKSPTLPSFPKGLLPRHKNVGKSRRKNDFADRFRVQVKGRPATTITSHICKDGNYYVHYDPRQCRSLTVREAARLQTFPDSYFFFGERTAQYQQVGNAVPPLLAFKLATVVSNAMERNEASSKAADERGEAFI